MRLIDADELIKVVKEDINQCYRLGIGSVGPLSHFIDQINEQKIHNTIPTIHAKWKNGGNGIYDTCTACNQEIYLATPMNYCPNCGAEIEVNDETNNT